MCNKYIQSRDSAPWVRKLIKFWKIFQVYEAGWIPIFWLAHSRRPHTHTHTHTHEMDTEQTSGLGIPITRSSACSCSSCCCKISSCLCSSSSCRLMYSWRGRQQRMQRNTRGRGREKEPVISKVRRNCQVKCGRKEEKKTQTPLH